MKHFLDQGQHLLSALVAFEKNDVLMYVLSLFFKSVILVEFGDISLNKKKHFMICVTFTSILTIEER